MTITGFLARLKKTPRRGWRLTKAGAIRFGEPAGRGLCPLERVAGGARNDWPGAARSLGFGLLVGWDIVQAADLTEEELKTSLVPLRRRLLQATGLARIALRRRSR